MNHSFRRVIRAPFLLCVGLLFAAGTAGCGTPPSATKARPQVSIQNADFIETFAATSRFRLGQPGGFAFTPDDGNLLFLRSGDGRSFVQDLWILPLSGDRAGQERVLLTADQILRGSEEVLTAEELARRERARSSSRGIASFEVSPDGKQVLVPLSGKLYLVDLQSAANGTPKTTQLPSDGGSAVDPRWSPDSSKVSCVRGGALYVIDVSSMTQRRVSPEATDTVTFGEAEFVAQEEMDRSRGYWWSSDSQSIAYQRTDTSQLETFTIADARNPGKPAQSWKYPRAGKANAVVQLFTQSIARPDEAPTEVTWDREAFPYLTRISWGKGSPLLLLVQDRLQQKQVLLAASGHGSPSTILQESDPIWLNLLGDMPKPTESTGSFWWLKENIESDRTELLQVGLDGKLRMQVVTDESVIGFHDSPQGLVVQTVSSQSPLDSRWSSVDSQGRSSRIDALTNTGLLISKSGELALLSDFDELDRPRWRVAKRLASGPGAAQFTPTSWAVQSRAEHPGFTTNREYVRVRAEGRDFECVVLRPRNFVAGKKYPVLNFVYGGPHSNQVTRNPRQYLLNQWYADQGFIVVSIDGRGTPRKGRSWERAINGNLIDVPLQDQADAMKALITKYPEFDASRVGVFGWSFGGYFSAMATMRRSDIFRCGVAGAPVSDWRDYDTFYTERYLDLPTTEGEGANKAGYDASSVLTYCKDLSVPLLIIHGTADDNVYFTHSLQMTDTLFKAGRPFEFLPLAGQTHAVSRPEFVRPMHERIAQFFRSNLGG